MSPRLWHTLGVITLLVSLPALAETRVWLIGGGNTLENSQGQIEENVRWLQDIFTERGITTRTYFTDGRTEDETPDIIYFEPPGERNPVLEPILRVHGQGLAYAQATRRNSLTQVSGTTEKPLLVESLKQDFAQLSPEESVLLVYNGHGGIDPNDTLNNDLMLWGDTRLDISELSSLLNHAPARSEVRFVLTQCFSGSFSALIYEQPRSDTLAEQPRCGFLAESDRREAEGCDLDTNQAEFRDYTTYFFAALHGRTRLGEPIPKEEIDLDGSGDISFYEAHIYTLKNAYSSDLSRSTSEAYLEDWEPWYLRWNSFGKSPSDNDYRQARQAVAERHDLPSAGRALLSMKRERLSERSALARERRELTERIRKHQSALRAQLEQAIDAHGLSAETLTADAPTNMEADRIEQWSEAIQATQDYDELVRLQDAVARVDDKLLSAQRDQTQIEKVQRLSRLSRLTAYFDRYATAEAQGDMARLLSCEHGTLQ